MSTAMNTGPTRFSRTLLSAACVLALTAGAAVAQSAGGGGSSGGSDNGQDFKQPLRGKKARAPRAEAEGQPRAETHMTLRQSEGDDEYEVIIDGDKVSSAKVNGKDLPEKRIRRTDDRVELLDRDGNVMTTFLVGKGGVLGGGGGARTWTFTPGQPLMPSLPQGATGWTQPKVMLGINMTELPEEMADQLKVDADEVVFISRVLPGSPADKAGLKDKDVVVAINGERPATREKVAEAVRGKDPGDDVAFTVIRGGKERTLKIELAKYDPKVMQMGMPGATGFPDAEHQRQFEEQMKELSRRMPQGQGGHGGSFYFDPNNDNFRFFTPQAGGAESPELKARLKELDSRMAELDKKMEELTARLDKLNKSLEQRRER
jgi:hypothetical protein